MRRHPERWSVLLGDAPDLAVPVEWVTVPAPPKRDRSVGKIATSPPRPPRFVRDEAPMITVEIEAEIRRLVFREAHDRVVHAEFPRHVPILQPA